MHIWAFQDPEETAQEMIGKAPSEQEVIQAEQNLSTPHMKLGVPEVFAFQHEGYSVEQWPKVVPVLAARSPQPFFLRYRFEVASATNWVPLGLAGAHHPYTKLASATAMRTFWGAPKTH